MNKLLMMFSILTSTAFAAKVEDVKILNVKSGKEDFEIKMQMKDGPADSYFFVDIVKSDPAAFDKLALVMNKMVHKGDFKLDLNIISFSPSPSGSYYKSEGITFSGSAVAR